MAKNARLAAISGAVLNTSQKSEAAHIARLGLVSRNHRHKFENGVRDFSFIFREAVSLLDSEKCDAILFALWTFDRRSQFDLSASLRPLQNVQTIFVEEFSDVPKRKRALFFVYRRVHGEWRKSEPIAQCFGSISNISQKKIESFVKCDVPEQRLIGNSCVIICGESNAVPVSRPSWRADDRYGLRQAIADAGATVILNPGHDLMLRPEMKIKRKFLSENGRFVVSVWNKGKTDRRGRNRDGQNCPPWTLYFDGSDCSRQVKHVYNKLSLDIGVADLRKILFQT